MGGGGGGVSGGVVGGSGVAYHSNFEVEVDPRVGWSCLNNKEGGGELPDIVVPRLSLAHYLWKASEGEVEGEGKGKGFRLMILSKFCSESPDNVFDAMNLIPQVLSLSLSLFFFFFLSLFLFFLSLS